MAKARRIVIVVDFRFRRVKEVPVHDISERIVKYVRRVLKPITQIDVENIYVDRRDWERESPMAKPADRPHDR